MAKNYFADEPMPTLFTPTAAPVEQPVSQGRIGDTIDSLQSGGLSALGGMFDFIGAQGLAQSLYSSSNDQQAQMSERGREALGQQFIQEDEQGNFELGEGATDLDTWLLTMANVAGQFAGTAIPGAGAAGLAGKAASLGAKGKNIANIASMGATGGAAATGQGMEQARQEVQNMPDTLLADSPLFGDVLRGVHANQPELSNVEKWEAAKTALANKVAQEVRTDPKVLLANFGASAIGDPIIGKALTGARLAKSGALRSALAGFVTEGSTEAVQAGVQQLGVNQALQPIDNRDEMQGVVAAGLNEGLAGGGFGAAAGGIGGLVNRQPSQQTPQTEPTAEPAPQPAVDPVTEQMKASNPNLGEAMASMDQHSTNVKNEVDNLDIPTAARQAGFDTNAGAGQFGDFITSPSQESIQSMRNQSIADMVNDAINNIGPTPDDRFSPIKYQHVGELLSPEQSTELQPAPRQNAQIGNGFIDGEVVAPQSLLPTQQQTQNRQAFERVQSEFNNQPAQIESKDIIFGEDGRPRQQAAERVKQAGKSAQNLLPQKDIIFAGNESGVNVARNGKPFKSMKEARNSKLARQAKRQGLTVDVVPFDNGYGWKVDAPATVTNDGTIPQNPETITETNAQPTANIAGDPINGEWTAFNEQSETKNIPRAEMPQIKAENRGAMVNFMNARDISHEQDEVPASSLKPTQQEFSPAKVKKAMEFEGGNRSILVSSDNYVLDGHHQWLAAREKGEPVKVIRLNAPIEQLVPLAKEMPSTETQDSNGTDSPAVTEQKPVKRKVFNWDSVELSKNYTANELDQWIKELAADPENKNLAGGIDLYDKPTMKKIDKLSSAVMFLQQQGKENNNISEVEANRIKQEEAKKRAENKKTRLSDIISKVSDQTLTDADKVTATTEQANELPSILKTTKRKWLQSEAKKLGIKKGSPGYDAAIAKIEESYEPAIDKALAESSFETYQEFNSDTPESINRQAYSELRKEFGYDKAPPPDAIKPNEDAEPPKSGFSLPETLNVDGMTADEIEAVINKTKNELANTKTEDWGNLRGQGKRTGGMVMGGMRDSSLQGEKSYLNPIGKLEDVNKADYDDAIATFNDNSIAKSAYGKARSAGFDHDTSIRYGLSKVADIGMTFSELLKVAKQKDKVSEKPANNKSSTNQATVKQESINDFGEKLGGARKDVWGGFSEAIQDQQNTAELPLSKAWPEPNYKELAEKGVSAESIALMAAMRSEIPSKPRVASKVSRWSEKVNTLKSFAADLMSGDRDIATVMQNMRNHSSKLAAIVDAIPSIAKADLDTLKSVADYRINSGSFSIFGGKTYSPSKVFYFIERNGRPVYDGASETLSDVQALLTKVIKAEQADGSNATNGKKSKISVYRDRYTKDVYLGWKGAAGVLKIKSFDDLGAAREYLKNNRDEVEQTLQKMKETPSMRKPVNDDRIGPERYAENVTPDTFGEAFGFRGVEFGNWVEQAKRQKDLNQAYDGLMDLAEALDLPPKALSLNGQLGLAFGARGRGGKEPAAAHYEPDTVVINLTKKSGAGSLAHEWWHALDNYFGKQKSRGEFITESPYSMSSDEIRPEMASAFKHVKSAIAQSGLPERSRELDTRRSKAYWATPVEMTARSFETYIIDKLNQQGITNDYLANVVSDEAWTAAESLGFESDNTYPYPNKEEQEKINPAYQTLFDTVESENTSEGIRLFSKSKKPASSKSISTEQAQRIADQFVKDLKGANGITVSILDDTATAEKLWRMSLDGATVKGAYSELSKTVYIIAENINDLTDLKQTLAHETIAHGGLDTVIGKEAKQAFIDRIKKTKGRKAFEKYWKDANNDYWDMSDDVKAEEIFARFVENEPSKGELKYWWNALKRWIKAQLDKAGIMYREDDELTAMRDMLQSIVKGFKAQREPMVSSQAEMTYSQSDKKFSRTADNDSQEKSKIADAVKKAINRENRFEKSSVPEWDALNAQLRETDKTAGEKIKRQLSRWFMPGGNMPETVKQATRGRDRDVAVHEFDVSMLVGKLNSAMKAAKINPDRLTDDQWSKYHQFLIGENDGQSLKQSERETLILMREHIDGLTQDYVASVNNKLQQRFEEDGSIDPKESARLEKMLGNIGKYLNRSYKAFDDPNWFEKIPTDVIDDARTYLMKQYKKDGATIEEAQQKAQVTMNEMVKTGTAYDSLGSFIAESKLGSKDLSTLIPRKDIAPEIRALLGEYVDPRINYAKSVSKMSAMIANDKLLNTIRDMGINNFIFEKDNRPPNATVQLAGEKSEVYAPLNGMWTTPEIKEAFEDAMGGERGEGWLDKAIQINGFIKYGKTVLSPTTAMRNVMSSYFFTVANGHFNQKYMKQAVAAFNAQVKGKVTDGESDYMKRLIKLGVVYDSANAGEMVKMMTDGKVSQMLEGKSGAAFENLRWLTDKATGFYRFGDDFWKIVGFENEKAALIRTGMAESDAEIVAAERIQDTYPTYSRVGKAGVWLSRFPLAGTFVSFPAEIIRTTANMIKLAASEIKSENPEIRAMGAKRVVGISLASGGMFALGALTKAMFGVTDDEEEALRDLAPPWQKNSTFLYAGRDKDGNLRYFDMTFMDPYAYWKRPIEAIMRNQPLNEAITSSIGDMVSPFLGTDISAGKLLEVVSNKKESGGQVYKENDTAIRQGADIAGHLALGLAPGAVNNAWRIGMAAADVKRSTGKPYSLSDEMLALAGFRSSTFDPKIGLYYRTFDFNSAIAEARKELSGVLRNPNKVSDDEISAAKERAKTKQEQAFKQMSRLIKAAETGGASRSQVVQIILLAGISKRNAGFLLRGQVPPVNLSDRSFESAVKRAQLIMDSETAKEVRSRFNRIVTP